MDFFSNLFTAQPDAGQPVRPLPTETPATDFFSGLFTGIAQSASVRQETQTLASSSGNEEDDDNRGSGRSKIEPKS
jgi:hypothetical protein